MTQVTPKNGAEMLSAASAALQQAAHKAVAPEGTKEQKQSEKLCNKLNRIAIDGANKSHELVQQAAVADLKHFEKYGDARPMDRLIKGLPDSFYKQGLIFWVKQNSPIWWNPQQEVKVRKEGDANYVPLNVKAAEKTPWQHIPETQRTMNREITPFSIMTVFERLENLQRQLDNAVKEDSKRGFDASYGSEQITRNVINTIVDAITPYKRAAEQRKRKADAEAEARKAAAAKPQRKVKLIKAKRPTPRPPVVTATTQLPKRPTVQAPIGQQ